MSKYLDMLPAHKYENTLTINVSTIRSGAHTHSLYIDVNSVPPLIKWLWLPIHHKMIGAPVIR